MILYRAGRGVYIALTAHEFSTLSACMLQAFNLLSEEDFFKYTKNTKDKMYYLQEIFNTIAVDRSGKMNHESVATSVAYFDPHARRQSTARIDVEDLRGVINIVTAAISEADWEFSITTGYESEEVLPVYEALLSAVLREMKNLGQ